MSPEDCKTFQDFTAGFLISWSVFCLVIGFVIGWVRATDRVEAAEGHEVRVRGEWYTITKSEKQKR